MHVGRPPLPHQRRPDQVHDPQRHRLLPQPHHLQFRGGQPQQLLAVLHLVLVQRPEDFRQIGETNFRKRHVKVKVRKDPALDQGQFVLADRIRTPVQQGRHFGRVDLVHFGADQHKRRPDFLMIILRQGEAQPGQLPQVRDRQVEGAFGDVDFFAQFEDPLGALSPVVLLDGLELGVEGGLIREVGHGNSFVELRVLGEGVREGVAHLHRFLLLFNYILFENINVYHSLPMFSINRKCNLLLK